MAQKTSAREPVGLRRALETRRSGGRYEGLPLGAIAAFRGETLYDEGRYLLRLFARRLPRRNADGDAAAVILSTGAGRDDHRAFTSAVGVDPGMGGCSATPNSNSRPSSGSARR